MKLGIPNLVKITGVENSPPDSSVTDFLPGDFILTHGDNFYSRLIQFGQAWRFRGVDAKYAYYTHAAMIITTEGALIEAVSGGVKQTNLSDYHPTDYTLVHINATVEDRNEAILFAYHCLAQSYGWVTILSIALSLLTGLKFSFGFYGQEICSGLVARALERTSAIFDKDPAHLAPADLAKFVQAVAPR